MLDVAAVERALSCYLMGHPESGPGPALAVLVAPGDAPLPPPAARAELVLCLTREPGPGRPLAGISVRVAAGGAEPCELFGGVAPAQLGDLLRAILIVRARNRQRAGAAVRLATLVAQGGLQRLRAEVDSVWAERGGDPRWDQCRALAHAALVPLPAGVLAS